MDSRFDDLIQKELVKEEVIGSFIKESAMVKELGA